MSGYTCQSYRPRQNADRHTGVRRYRPRGLPRGRTTMLLGGAGTGKTVFALQTLVNGAGCLRSARRSAPRGTMRLQKEFDERRKKVRERTEMERRRHELELAQVRACGFSGGDQAPGATAGRRMMADEARKQATKQADAKDPQVYRLYVAGNAPNSLLAVDNFKAIARDYMVNYRLEIIDILDEPMRAISDGVLVTPTLIRLSPPVVRVIGNLSDTKTVVLALGLKRTAT